MASKMVITVAMIWLAEFPPRFVAAAAGPLISLDAGNTEPDDLGEAVVGNFHKESTAFGWQSPLRFLALIRSSSRESSTTSPSPQVTISFALCRQSLQKVLPKEGRRPRH